MSNIPKRFYEFGHFRIDPDERLLWKDGQPVPLPPKVFATLLVLVERAPHIVEKDDLLKTIWPDTFVEESNLSQNVFSLRKILGEPECIENIPKRGYRFIAPVHRPETVSLDKPAARQKLRRAGFAAGAAALLLLIGAVLYLRYAHSRSQARSSIVVLPFLNLSGDPANDYVSDGLTEELTDALSRLENVQVVARTTAFQYKGKSQDIRAIGKQVGATAVVEGSVRREGNNVRITAQLNGVANGYHLWSQTYERDLTEIFSIQREIATAIGTALRGRLKGVRSTAPRVVNPEAYDDYLRARYHLIRFNRKDNDEAIALLEKSTGIDPLFAPAQAQLAFVYGLKSFFFNATDPQWEDKAFAAIQKAEALEIESPEVHYVRSELLWTHSHGFPHREALAEERKALSIQPSFDDAWHHHAVILFHIGHIQEAWREIEKTLSINPANDQARYRIGPMLNYQGKWQEAIDALNHVPREVSPGLWSYQMAWALQSLNRLPEASRLLESALAENANDPGGNLYGARAMVRAKSSDRQGAEADISTAIRVGKGFGHFHHTAYSLAAVYSVLGDLDKAQEWIENAANDGFPCYTLFEVDPNLQRLRATPRFQAFVANLRREYEHIPGETN
jgi:TolB-like protein/DNA-binding winged helix-turn-helix (wHTH) protein/tetratricopeptide (TPR) repeat protein